LADARLAWQPCRLSSSLLPVEVVTFKISNATSIGSVLQHENCKMDDLFKPVKTTRKVQTNIDKFETLSLAEAAPTSRPTSARSKFSVVDLTSEGSAGSSENFSLRPSLDSSITSRTSASLSSKHKRHDSTAFLQKSYLKKTPPSSLVDDAREILKGQPEVEDLGAVLQYLRYGVEGKHDFNIRVPSPKASQIINVLVTVTIPDLWQPLQQRKLSAQHNKLKFNLLTSLTSVSGLGALLMQIKQLSATSTDQKNPLLTEFISVLSAILASKQVLSSFLSDATTLLSTEAQRRVFWQEATSLLAGSKVLSTMSQVLSTHQDLKGLSEECKRLGDGPKYSEWLAQNISTAAIAALPSSQDQHTRMLSQVLQRALNLGYRGI
jgi:hypothetical protein